MANKKEKPKYELPKITPQKDTKSLMAEASQMLDENIEKEKKLAVKKADNRPSLEFLTYLSALGQGKKVNLQNAYEIQNRIDEYLQLCIQNNVEPNLSQLALALGTTRGNLEKWAVDVERFVDRADVIRAAMTLIDANISTAVQYGDINPLSGIFLLKNWCGYKDNKEVLVAQTSPLGAIEGSKEEMAKKYLESVPED